VPNFFIFCPKPHWGAYSGPSDFRVHPKQKCPKTNSWLRRCNPNPNLNLNPNPNSNPNDVDHIVSYRCKGCRLTPTGVATGGHVPTLPWPGWIVRFAQIQRVFFGGVGVGGSRLHMSLRVHCISSTNTSRKCVCPLQIVYAYLASGEKLCPWTPLGDFRSPDPLCPPYLQTLATLMLSPLIQSS